MPLERFSWPLTAAIVLLVLDFLIPERKSSHRLSIPDIITAGRRIKKHMTPLVLLVLVASLTATDLQASEAEDAYSREEYLKASELYSKALKENPDVPTLHYNYGTAAYKNNMYDEAIASFTQALKGEDLALQAKAYYNRGNALFQKGTESQQGDPKAALEQWEQALESFDSALKLNPDDSLADENKKYVEQKVKELQEQMEQQQEKNDQKNDDQQDKDQQQKDGDKNNQSGDAGKDQPQEQKSPDEQDSDADDKKQDGQQEPEESKDDQTTPEQPENTEGEKEQGAEQPKPAAGQDDQQNGATDQDAEKNRDMQRRELGKMTKDEAENLLNALKNEEGELNFVPGSQDAPVRRDW